MHMLIRNEYARTHHGYNNGYECDTLLNHFSLGWCLYCFFYSILIVLTFVSESGDFFFLSQLEEKNSYHFRLFKEVKRFSRKTSSPGKVSL